MIHMNPKTSIITQLSVTNRLHYALNASVACNHYTNELKKEDYLYSFHVCRTLHFVLTSLYKVCLCLYIDLIALFKVLTRLFFVFTSTLKALTLLFVVFIPIYLQLKALHLVLSVLYIEWAIFLIVLTLLFIVLSPLHFVLTTLFLVQTYLFIDLRFTILLKTAFILVLTPLFNTLLLLSFLDCCPFFNCFHRFVLFFFPLKQFSAKDYSFLKQEMIRIRGSPETFCVQSLVILLLSLNNF